MNARTEGEPEVVDYAKLKIKDQSALVNAIAGTYKDVHRACMEYIDNAVDAAYQASDGASPRVKIEILVDEKRKEILIRDDAGGMTVEELKDLLESVGLSKKKAVPWANGQFGFGVHAFRAFAKQASFTSRTVDGSPHRLMIHRKATERDSIPVERLPDAAMRLGTTEVRIERFDKGVVRKGRVVQRLREEIETHFQHVLSEEGVNIHVGVLGGAIQQCFPFDHSTLPGVAFARDLVAGEGEDVGRVMIDLKLLEGVARGQSATVTVKGRRIAALSDLTSFRQHCRRARRDPSVWADPCLVGVIEVGSIAEPNLTRDDLRQSSAVFDLYEGLIEMQAEIEDLVNERRRKKMGRNKRHVGDMVSSYLSKYMRGFKFASELEAGTGLSAAESGGHQPGGGGAGPDLGSGQGKRGEVGKGGEGDEDRGGGPGPARIKGRGSTAAKRAARPSAPNIIFDDYEGGERSFLRGYDIVVNTAHPDFVTRNKSRDEISVTERMLNYIATVVSPLCVVKISQRKGIYLEPLELGAEIAGFILGLESFLQENAGRLKRD